MGNKIDQHDSQTLEVHDNLKNHPFLVYEQAI